MTEVQHTPETTSPRTVPPRDGLKYRGSCNTCATSKVKCDKVRPSCGRCLSRSTQCEYLVTKRSGRKRETRAHSAAKPTKEPRSDTPRERRVSSSDPQSSSIQSESRHQSPGTASQSHLASLGHLSRPTFPDPTSESDNLFMSLGSDEQFVSIPPLENDFFSEDQMHPGAFDIGLPDLGNFADLGMPSNGFPMFDQGTVEFPSCGDSFPPLGNRSRTTTPIQPNGNLQSPPSLEGPHKHPQDSCTCVMEVLGQLQLLLKDMPSSGGVTSTKGDNTTIHSVVSENEQAIETVSNILQCSCSQDAYLLSVTSLIISKTLDWYTTAVKAMNASGTDSKYISLFGSDDMIPVGGYCPDNDEGGDQCRVAAQLVLGELQRVKRLVNLLSHRLSAPTDRSTTRRDSSVAIGQEGLVQGDGEGTPSSTFMLDHTKENLRKRVHTLSLEIIRLLRRR